MDQQEGDKERTSMHPPNGDSHIRDLESISPSPQPPFTLSRSPLISTMQEWPGDIFNLNSSLSKNTLNVCKLNKAMPLLLQKELQDKKPENIIPNKMLPLPLSSHKSWTCHLHCALLRVQYSGKSMDLESRHTTICKF